MILNNIELNAFYDKTFYEIYDETGLYVVIYPPFDNFKETEFKAYIVARSSPFISFTNHEHIRDENLIKLKEKCLNKLIEIQMKITKNNTNSTLVTNIPGYDGVTFTHAATDTFLLKAIYSEPVVIKTEIVKDKIEITYRQQLLNSMGLYNLQDVIIYKHIYALASLTPEIKMAEVIPPQDEYYSFE